MEAMHAELIGLDRRILVPATEEHPRNMGADLVELADGSLLLAYSRWLGGVDDYDGSKICGMTSTDGGDTWSGPFDMAEPDPDTEAVRMPCFLRLKGGQLACFARYRSSVADTWVGKITCRDEARIADGVSAWSVPVRISPPPPGTPHPAQQPRPSPDRRPGEGSDPPARRFPLAVGGGGRPRQRHPLLVPAL